MPLEDFAPLLGEWREEATFESKTFNGRAIFEWLGERGFLVWRSEVPAPFPGSIAIIGPDDGDDLAMSYFDARGVARVYRTTLRDGEWRIWRDHPGFSQRFFGTFTKDGKRIEARWEKNEDDKGWQLDFPLTYTRVR